MALTQEERIWYESFLEILKKNNITPDNPYSLGKLIEFGDIDDVEEKLDKISVKKNGKDPKIVQGKINDRINIFNSFYTPALIKKDTQGEKITYDGKNYAKYLCENIDNSFNEEQIKQLYKLAKNKKLGILTEKSSDPQLICVHGVNSKAIHVSYKSFNTLDNNDKPLQGEEQKNKIRENQAALGVDQAGYKALLNTLDIISFYHDSSQMFSDIAVYDSQVGASKDNKSVQYADQAAQNQTKYNVCKIGAKHPDWFKSEEGMQILHCSASIAAKQGNAGNNWFTFDEKKIAASKKTLLASVKMNEFLDKMMRKTGTHSINELMNSEVYDNTGRQIKADTEYGFVEKLAAKYVKNEDIYFNVIGNGGEKTLTPFMNSSTFPPIADSGGYTSCIEQVKQLKEELLKTESFFSINGSEYSALKKALKDFDKNIHIQDYYGWAQSRSTEKIVEDGSRESRVVQDKGIEQTELLQTLQKEMRKVAAAAKAYQDKNMKKSLSTRTKNRLCVASKFALLNNKVQNLSGENPLKIDPTEALYTKFALQRALDWRYSKKPEEFKKSLDMLTKPDALKAEIENIKKDPDIPAIITGKGIPKDKYERLTALDNKGFYEVVKKTAQARADRRVMNADKHKVDERLF